MPIRLTRNTMTSGNDWPHSRPTRLARNTDPPEDGTPGRPTTAGVQPPPDDPLHIIGAATRKVSPPIAVLGRRRDELHAMDPTGSGSTTMPTATGSSPSGRLDEASSSAAARAADSRVSHLAASLIGSPLYLTVTMNTLKQAPSSARRSLARSIVHPT